MNFDDLKLNVEALSGGKNTVLLDDQGMPSIMVRIPKFYLDDVIAGAPHTVHPAFIVNGVEKKEILISKYQNVVLNERAYSLPYKDPKDYVNFDQAQTYCKNKGAGWHLMTNAEWAALALWSKKNSTMPRGNNNYGADHAFAYERGVESYKSGDQTGRVATGSGPATWSHDHTNNGVFDLNGNVYEWTGGLRVVGGEIQIIPNNDAAVNTIDQSVGSAAWKAISSVDGSLLAPGSANTLKYDGKSTPTISTEVTTVASVNTTFETLAAEAGITVPTIMKSLALAPLDANHGSDRFYVNTEGERIPIRGGAWHYTSNAGVFLLYLTHSRSHSSSSVGFRSAYVI